MSRIHGLGVARHCAVHPLGSEPAGTYDCPTACARASSCTATSIDRAMSRRMRTSLLDDDHVRHASSIDHRRNIPYRSSISGTHSMFEHIEAGPERSDPWPHRGVSRRSESEEDQPQRRRLSGRHRQDADSGIGAAGGQAGAGAAEVDVVPADSRLAGLRGGRAAADVRRGARSGDVGPGRHVAHAGRHRAHCASRPI